MNFVYSPARLFFTLLLALSLGGGGSLTNGYARPGPGHAKLYGHVPRRAIEAARLRGRLEALKPLPVTVALPLRKQDELQDLLKRIYDPADPLYGHYLSPRQFAERFGPSQEDYDVVAGYMESLGFKVTERYPSRRLLDVEAPATAVEQGFNLRMQRYEARSGREFFAPDSEPDVPDFIASRIVGVIGLDNANVRHTYDYYKPADTSGAAPNSIGSGPGGGLTPSDIASVYNLDGVAADGSGQVLGLFELDGFNPSDIDAYTSYYGLPQVNLETVAVDGVSGRAGNGASEVTLDIELQIALAPGVSRIVVYEGRNSDTGILHTYDRIASDNVARQVSTSWGLSELQTSLSIVAAENAIFQQMALQGQTIFAASGDNGAYDSGNSALSVDDPASQPFVVAAGGTRLAVSSAMGYDHETTWNSNSVSGGAGGGGISSVWSMPFWQQGLASAGSMMSASMRNIPDVALNADPDTGYSIYYRGRWHIFGGTSCASPLWAALTARVNQRRAENGLGPIGFLNPGIYLLAVGSRYGTDFHDVSDGSTNLYYPAVTGYDDATGWGSPNGANLVSDLALLAGANVASPIRYFNTAGLPYTNEDVAYWQTPDGHWWMGDKTGKITAVGRPPWL